MLARGVLAGKAAYGGPWSSHCPISSVKIRGNPVRQTSSRNSEHSKLLQRCTSPQACKRLMDLPCLTPLPFVFQIGQDRALHAKDAGGATGTAGDKGFVAQVASAQGRAPALPAWRQMRQIVAQRQVQQSDTGHLEGIDAVAIAAARVTHAATELQADQRHGREI